MAAGRIRVESPFDGARHLRRDAAYYEEIEAMAETDLRRRPLR
jgi:hypothetical protein